jgi:spore maturation protein CgeB
VNIAFFASSLLSAYWNGAATYYRGIIKALHANGHRITFYEPVATIARSIATWSRRAGATWSSTTGRKKQRGSKSKRARSRHDRERRAASAFSTSCSSRLC